MMMALPRSLQGRLLVLVLGTVMSVWLVIALTMLMGAGMANIMAPATDAITRSLPPASAGRG